MKLNEWINSHPPYRRVELIAKIALYADVTAGAVRHWVNGTRKCPPHKAPIVEEATNGIVTRYELRPDFPWNGIQPVEAA